jgi:hypothetical protein
MQKKIHIANPHPEIKFARPELAIFGGSAANRNGSAVQ